jgi:hypothetical protein
MGLCFKCICTILVGMLGATSDDPCCWAFHQQHYGKGTSCGWLSLSGYMLVI